MIVVVVVVVAVVVVVQHYSASRAAAPGQRELAVVGEHLIDGICYTI